jgi:hypothetical protein
MTAKADRIQALLSDESLNEAIDNVSNAIHKGWEETAPSDTEALQEWHRRLFTLRSVVANLEQAIQDGKLEDYIASEKLKPAVLGDLSKWKPTQ